MPKLKDRNRQIPNGFVFIVPEVGYKSSPYSSFNAITNTVLQITKSNPSLAVQHNWPRTYDEVADWIDLYNALLCQQNGWNEYIMSPGSEPPPPKFMASSPEDQSRMAAVAGHVKKIWSGVKTLNEWIDSGEAAVDAETSAARALVCADCPKNGKGDFTSWFTAPAAAAIQRQIERMGGRGLSTPSDGQVNVCEVCLCPMKLKVHTPLHFIRSHTTPETLAELRLVPGCWVAKEIDAK